MAAQALPIGQASSRRFFPGETVVTCGVDALVQQGRLNPVPYLHRHLNGDWGDLDDYDKRQNDAALESGEDRLFFLPGRTRPAALDYHRMGSQRDHAATAQRVLISPRRRPPAVSSSHHGHAIARGGACPIFLEHHHVLDLETTAAEAAPVQGELLDAESSPLTLSLQDFVGEFGDELLDALNSANPPVYNGQPQAHRQLVVASLKRKLFPAQAEVVHAAAELLIDRGERAAIVNGEMGCGKTTVGIATAAVLNAEGYRRTLVLSPPHLVYKWRREIQETVAGAKVWCSTGRTRSSSSSSCASS